MKSWRDNIFFILIEPKESGNIGASARAMKDMGFKNLELVKPRALFDWRGKIYSMWCDWCARSGSSISGSAKSNRGKKFGYWDHKAAWKTKRIDHSSEGESEKNSKESVSALLSYGHPEMSRVKSAPWFLFLVAVPHNSRCPPFCPLEYFHWLRSTPANLCAGCVRITVNKT